MTDFIPCQQVPTTRKSRRTGNTKGTLFFLRHIFQNGALSLCKYKCLWPMLKHSQFNSYLSCRMSSLKKGEQLLTLSCICEWHWSCLENSFSCNYLLKHFTTRLSLKTTLQWNAVKPGFMPVPCKGTSSCCSDPLWVLHILNRVFLITVKKLFVSRAEVRQDQLVAAHLYYCAFWLFSSSSFQPLSDKPNVKRGLHSPGNYHIWLSYLCATHIPWSLHQSSCWC